jgi:ABC-2 type transport system permease protein
VSDTLHSASDPTTDMTVPATPSLAGPPHVGRVLHGLALRDLRVLRRDWAEFLTRTLMQPLLFIFVFAFVFPRIGQTIGAGAAGEAGFATVLVPGLVAIAVLFQGITAIALPLSTELGGTREIEDRIMAPVHVNVVAIEKVLFAATQAIVAGLVVLPILLLIPDTPVRLSLADPLLALLIIPGAALLSGAIGLALGVTVEPRQIGLMFSVVILPLTFLGAVYYPWAALDAIPWLQTLVLVNPLVYVSEGLRAVLTPDVPTMAPWVIVVVLYSYTGLLLAYALRGFARRTLS